MDPKPLFIVIDGLDGCGKSTLADAVCKELWSKDVPHVKTAEPSRSKVGIFIRDLLRTREQQQTFEEREVLADRDVMAHLFAADRLLHSRVIEAALAERKHVVCDRWLLSSLVYQCGCSGLPDPELLRRFSRLLALNGEVLERSMPDLVVYLRVPAEVAFNRVHARGSFGHTYFEGKDRVKFAQAAGIWEEAVGYYAKVFQRDALVLDGETNPVELAGQVFRHLQSTKFPWFPRLPKI